MLTDANETVVWRAAYEAFGQAEVDENPDGDGTSVTFKIRFPGQYFDAETGLHYNRFRYYDPGIGRYISADPIGQAGGINLYPYAALNPTNEIDPLGLVPPFESPALVTSLPRLLSIKSDAAAFASAVPRLGQAEEDAVRHCVAACEAAKELGAGVAAAAGTANEVQRSAKGGQTTGDRKMDDHNNSVGIGIGSEQTCPPPDCRSRCLAALPANGASGPVAPLTPGVLDISRGKTGGKYQRGGYVR